MTAGLSLVGALVLWVFVFVWHPIGFWPSMTLAVVVLGTTGLVGSLRSGAVWGPAGDGGRRGAGLGWSDLAWGFGSALALAAGFHAGGWVLRALWSEAGSHIGAVYAMDTSVPPAAIAAALLLVIGPGEELFWRLFVQERLSERLGRAAGWAATTAVYAGVHVVTGNPVLVLAALVAGGAWGLMWWKVRRPWALLVSHAVWDVLMFVVWPA